MTPDQVVQNQSVVTHAFAGLPVSDYKAAYDWYVRFFGRPADMFPHGREAVWRLSSTASIYVVQDSERAGKGVVTLALDDLDAYEKRLTADGLTLTEQSGRASPRRLVIEDADGNHLTLFHDPSRSGGEARHLRQRFAMTPDGSTLARHVPGQMRKCPWALIAT
jgi:catechol 2,3-dioxygenase-like lactoylglutathione lyase family enzyme